MIFERIFKSFQEQDIRYAVIGGIAVNLHGYNRLTGDLDIILSLDDETLRGAVVLADSDEPVRWTEIDLEQECAGCKC